MDTATPGRWQGNWQQFPRSHPVWTSALGALLLLVLLLVLFDWNWLRGPVSRMVSSATGREFRIDGNLDVDLLPIRIRAEKIYLGNVPWSEEPAMATVARLDMRVRFWPLFIGRFVLPDVSVERPHLRIERNAEGAGNWVFGDETEDCSDAGCASNVRILQLQASQGILQVREPTFQTSVDIRFESAQPATDDGLAPLVLKGTGTYRAQPFELNGKVDSPLALQGQAQPYQVDMTARAGDTRARAFGTLRDPLQTQDVTVNFEMRGANLADLYALSGIVLPDTPPYELKGILSRHGQRFAYRDFKGTVGDSDLAGNAEVRLDGARPHLTARLHSQVLDFDDLAGFIGGTPATGEGETASAQQKQAASAQRATGRLLPATPIKLDRLRAMDADVKLTAARVDARRLPLEAMSARLILEDGDLILDPMDFTAAGGKLSSTVRVDARREPARFAIAMSVQQLALPRLMPKVKLLNDSVGNISGDVTLTGHGNSAASVMATSNGNMSLIMGQGRVSNLLMEVAGLDIAEALAFLIGKDRQVTLRCAYAEFGVENGVATARSVAFDTTDTALLMRGDLSFTQESLNLTLLPRPKDFSPLSVRTPIEIGGSFADPSIAPKGGPLLLRGAAVAALAAIAPPLALLGLLETGPGDDTNCGAGKSSSNEDRKEKKQEQPRTPPGPRPPAATPTAPGKQ